MSLLLTSKLGLGLRLVEKLVPVLVDAVLASEFIPYHLTCPHLLLLHMLILYVRE